MIESREINGFDCMFSMQVARFDSSQYMEYSQKNKNKTSLVLRLGVDLACYRMWPPCEQNVLFLTLLDNLNEDNNF